MNQPFERIIIVMFENQYRSYVLQDAFMRKLASAGAMLTSSFGCFHPSQTNYLAAFAGEVCSVSNDTPPATPLMQQNLVDLLEAKGISWKAYMEGYPGDPWNPNWKNPSYSSDQQPINEFPNDGKSLARYFRKHNAFASFHSIQSNEERWNKIVSDNQFWKDVSSNSLPQFSWFTPDIWNDGHYLYNTHVDTNPRTQLIPQISGWLEYVLLADIQTSKVQGGIQTGLSNIGLNLNIDLLLKDPDKAWSESNVPAGTLILLTFDEADFDAVGFDTAYDGQNQVYSVLLGDMIQPNTVIDVPYNHYSLIKTIEKNYNLGNLGKNDKEANWYRFLWGEKFSWSDPISTGINSKGSLAASYLKNKIFLLFNDQNGELWQSVFQSGSLAPQQSTGLNGFHDIALACLNDTLHLILVDQNGNLYTSVSQGDNQWTEAKTLGVSTSGSITITSYQDATEESEKLMLCWQNEAGFIQYIIYSEGKWDDQINETGQLTDGPMGIGQMGPSLYLIYKERNTRHLKMTSYNLAPYNSFKALAFNDKPAPQNNTSLHSWSPADMHVGHFAKKLNAVQNDYLSLGQIALGSIEGEMHLIHRGGYADTSSAFTEFFGLTGIFTAEHQLTNGYGTIDQAGWTLERELTAIQLDPGSPIAIASDGVQLMVVWQEAKTKEINFLTGAYSKI